MNIILCNASCEHQADGYCTLENSSAASQSAANSDCCFFNPIANSKPDENQAIIPEEL